MTDAITGLLQLSQTEAAVIANSIESRAEPVAGFSPG